MRHGWMIGLLLLGACASKVAPGPQLSPDLEYRIGSEDVLEVLVYQDPELSRTLPVRPDGRISVPLIGDIEASGKTARELAQELDQRFEGYIQSPRVTVMVHEINAPRVFVVGEVAHPGAYPLRGRLDVLQALALAGGLGDFASRGSIVLIRRGPDGETRSRVDWDAIVGGREAVPLLLPGDTIFVP